MSNSDEKLGRYSGLQVVSGLGGILGSGCIVGLSATITVIRDYLNLTATQVGVVSSILTVCIGVGSLFGGRFADAVGRIRVYNAINYVYAVGALLMAFAPNYGVLIAGAILLGLTSGTELPVALSIMSRDAPNDVIANKLVSSHQIYWHFGQFLSYLVTFFLSTQGIIAARVVFIGLAVVALVAAVWRTVDKNLAQIHLEGDARAEQEMAAVTGHEVGESVKTSVTSVLFGKHRNVFLLSFFGIMVYYVAWNLLANTWGQFQTYMFRVNGANQTFATGIGLILLCVATIMSMIFTRISGGNLRRPLFFLGGAMQVVAMAIMAVGGQLWSIVTALALFNIFNSFAGEAMYKVWTQNAFPADVRASIQGFLNGFSRLCCAAFAVVTPALVSPDRIHGTMWLFFGIILISYLAGVVMLNTEKKRQAVLEKA